MPGTSFYKQIY